MPQVTVPHAPLRPRIPMLRDRYDTTTTRMACVLLTLHVDKTFSLRNVEIGGAGVVRFFVFTVMPFGLKPASYVFTKVLRPFTKYWRGMGIKVVIYIDDGISARKTEKLAKEAGDVITVNLTEAGFYINWSKSNLEPKQVGRWLGTVVDTRKMRFSVPAEKINKVRADIDYILEKDACTAKQLAKIGLLPVGVHL